MALRVPNRNRQSSAATTAENQVSQGKETQERPFTKKAQREAQAKRQEENKKQWLVDGDSHRLGSRMTSVLLSSIRQDPNNSRTRFISVALRRRMTQLFQEKLKNTPDQLDLSDDELRSYIEIAKQETSDTPEMEIAGTLKEIWEFARHLKENQLLQPFAITSDGKGGNNVVFGNVRFISMCIAHGEQSTVECLQYPASPQFVGVKRFIENNARNDVPLTAKLRDMGIAIAEIVESDLGLSQTQIANQLGLSRSRYYVYRDILDNAEILKLINSGKIGSIEFAHNLSKYKPRDAVARKLAITALEAQNEPLTDFDTFIKRLHEASQAPVKNRKRSQGRPSKIKIPPIDRPSRLKEILAPSVLEMEGWSAIDWEDSSRENVTRIEGLIRKLLKSAPTTNNKAT